MNAKAIAGRTNSLQANRAPIVTASWPHPSEAGRAGHSGTPRCSEAWREFAVKTPVSHGADFCLHAGYTRPQTSARDT